MFQRARFGMTNKEAPSRNAGECGSAIVEFIFAATVLLIPMIYLILAAAALEAGSYAVVSAADQAAKVYAVAEDKSQAEADAENVVSRAMRNYGFESAKTEIVCSERCLTPGSVVKIRVSLTVPLPMASSFTQASLITVDALSAQRVDRFG